METVSGKELEFKNCITIFRDTRVAQMVIVATYKHVGTHSPINCGLGVEGILKNSLMRQSLDNVTVVMVAFANFKKIACGQTRTNSADKREHRPESIGYQHMSNSSATKTHEQA